MLLIINTNLSQYLETCFGISSLFNTLDLKKNTSGSRLLNLWKAVGMELLKAINFSIFLLLKIQKENEW